MERALARRAERIQKREEMVTSYFATYNERFLGIFLYFILMLSW